MNKQKEKKWKEVVPSDRHDWDAEPVLEGKYVDLEEDVGPNNSRLYHIQTPDGGIKKIWGCVTLDARMKEVPLNSEVRIELKKVSVAENEKQIPF